GVTQRGADYDFYFEVNSTGMSLAFGTYTTTVTVGSTDASGNVLHSRDIPVTLTVRDGLRITDLAVSANGHAGDSRSVATRTFTVVGPANTQWTATSGAPWLRVPVGTQNGPGDYQVTMDAGAMPSGSHDGTITIVNNADATDRATLRVHFFLLPSCPYLKPFNTGGRLGGDSGLDQAPVTFEFAIGTGTNAFPWTVSGPTWMRFDATSGMTSSTYSTLRASADYKNLAPGDYSGTMELISNVNGERCLNPIQVQARVEFNRLLVTSTGVAFSRFPGRSVLSRTLRVSDTRAEGDVAWNAVDDAAWLTVTNSGTTEGEQGGALALIADPAGLAAGQHYATVTISAANAGRVQNQQSVRVGLTIRDTDPPVSVAIPNFMDNIAANPVDPEFYVEDELGAFKVYDVYSGALLRSYPGLGGTYGFAVSGDGRNVYRILGTNLESFDPQTGVTQRQWSASLDRGGIIYARPDAHPVLIVGESVIVDLETHSVNGQYHLYAAQAGLSANQRMLYGASPYGNGNLSIFAQSLRYSSVAVPNVVIRSAGQYDSTNDAGYVGVGASQVSNRVFAAAQGLARRVEVIDGASMTLQPPLTLPAPQTPYFVDTSWNGRFAVMFSHSTTGDVVATFNDDGTPLGDWSAGSGAINYEVKSVVFAGDGTRLMSRTSDGGVIHAVN
ncbi:MAG TPA: hypothetical protein VFU13_06500, partial [Steroidobacteraceae bacterium]|nr:hypothetical protein [Steroidobacteraceae bacterium]